MCGLSENEWHPCLVCHLGILCWMAIFSDVQQMILQVTQYIQWLCSTNWVNRPSVPHPRQSGMYRGHILNKLIYIDTISGPLLTIIIDSRGRKYILNNTRCSMSNAWSHRFGQRLTVYVTWYYNYHALSSQSRSNYNKDNDVNNLYTGTSKL